MILKDKVMLITGASRGIGRETAIEAAKEGAVVLGVATNVQKLEETKKLVEEVGGTFYYTAADVSKYESCQKCVEELLKHTSGHLDVLVNGAGIFKKAPFLEMTPQQWKETIETDLDSVFYMTKVCIPYLIESKGNVVSISSQDAFYGCKNYAHYSAAKAGIIGMTRTLCDELGHTGVRFNCTAPGITDTDLTHDRIVSMRQMYLDYLSIPYIAEAKDQAALIVFLASDKAKFITGQCIHANGGAYKA